MMASLLAKIVHLSLDISTATQLLKSVQGGLWTGEQRSEFQRAVTQRVDEELYAGISCACEAHRRSQAAGRFGLLEPL